MAVLISTAILLGFLLENAYKYLSTNYINDWRSLLSVIFLLYLLIFSQIYILKTYKYQLDGDLLKNTDVKVENPLKIADDAVKMWKGNFSKTLSQYQSIFYNHQFRQIMIDMDYCLNQNRSQIPTGFDLKKNVGFGHRLDPAGGIFWTCVNEGNGTKNIVIIGNSHARGAHFGIEQNFRGVYKYLTLVAAGACMTVPWLEFYGEDELVRGGSGCKRYVQHLQEMLEQWKHPIDILIVDHLYYTPAAIKITPFTSPETDKFYLATQDFYTRMSKIARDVVFLPDFQFILPIDKPMRDLLVQIYENKPLDAFRFSPEKQFTYMPNVRDRIRAVHCPKCIRLDWTDLWCKNGTCEVVDFDRKIGFFFDPTHINVYGSLKLGEYVRQKYDVFMKSDNLTESNNTRR